MVQFVEIDQNLNIANKTLLNDTLTQLAETDLQDVSTLVNDVFHPDCEFNVSHPINELVGHHAIVEQFCLPLKTAFPDLEWRPDIIAGGIDNSKYMVGFTGHLVGTFAYDYLGIPANENCVYIRTSGAVEVKDNKIVVFYLLLDFLDLMRQVGIWPLVPSLGKEGQWLPPITHDGVLLSPQKDAVSERTIALILAMHQGLLSSKGRLPTREVLDEMGMVNFWHKNMMWYGPSGIGTTRGLQGFENYHQIPFVSAFQDRDLDPDKPHFIEIGDGYCCVTGGWGSLYGTHTGHNWLGLPATNKLIQMRVIDFYRCDDDTIIENWVPIDIIHMLYQMGIDVFGRVQHQNRQNKRLSVVNWLNL